MPSIKQVQINILPFIFYSFFPLTFKIFFFISASLRLSLCHGYAALFRLLAPLSLKVLKKNFYVCRKEVITGFNGLSLFVGSRVFVVWL